MNNSDKLDKILENQVEQSERMVKVEVNTRILVKNDEDKEKRIRSLEREKWRQRGAIAIIGTVFTALGTKLASLFN